MGRTMLVRMRVHDRVDKISKLLFICKVSIVGINAVPNTPRL